MDRPPPKRPRLDPPILGFHALAKGSKLICLAWAVGSKRGCWSHSFSSCCAHERHMGDVLCEFLDRAWQCVDQGGRLVCCSPSVAELLASEMARRQLVFLSDRWAGLRERLPDLCVDLGADDLMEDDLFETQPPGCSVLRMAQRCVRSAAPLPACARGRAAHSPVAREFCAPRDNGDPFFWVCTACGKNL